MQKNAIVDYSTKMITLNEKKNVTKAYKEVTMPSQA